MPTLEITTMIGCPLRCTFCPQDALRARYGQREKYLSLENFCRVLEKLPPHVRIDFSGMSEPFANPAAIAMLAHVLERGFNVALYTTLYGLTRADAALVCDLLRAHAAKVEVVCLHLPDRNGNMRGYKPGQDYAAVLTAFLALGAPGVLRRFEIMTMDKGGEVHDSLRAIVATLAPWSGLTRAGSLEVAAVAGQPVEETPRHDAPVGCSFTPFFDQNVLLPNGDVVVCCMDYSLKHKLGNLLEDDYAALFAAPGMGALHAENMRVGHSDRSICKSCSRATRYGLPAAKHQFWEKLAGQA